MWGFLRLFLGKRGPLEGVNVNVGARAAVVSTAGVQVREALGAGCVHARREPGLRLQGAAPRASEESPPSRQHEWLLREQLAVVAGWVPVGMRWALPTGVQVSAEAFCSQGVRALLFSSGCVLRGGGLRLASGLVWPRSA